MSLTIAIIAVTAIISILCFNDASLMDKLKFNAYDVKHSNHWYRFFTYGFVHAGWFHLIINMYVLYYFGQVVETVFHLYFPAKFLLYFILLYLGGLLLSIIPSFGKNKNNVFYNAVGASGAVSAIVFASIILFPEGRISIFPIPIGIPAPVFGLLYLAYEYYMDKRGSDNIGHDAHFWGAIYGVVLPIILRPEFGISFLKHIGLSI